MPLTLIYSCRDPDIQIDEHGNIVSNIDADQE